MITASGGGALICNDWRCKNDNDTANAYDNDNCRPDGVIVAEGESSSSSFVSAEKSARDIMRYATQARDAFPYYQHTSIGYGSTGSPQVLTACRTDEAARGESNLFELSRVASEEDDSQCAGRGDRGMYRID